jgi:hypothetical protein
MVGESQHEEYLRKAAEAERHQQRAKDPQAREAWERIVVGYLELAEIIRRQNQQAY